ncbi:MAG: urea amidolyase associated protein UAAP1 [Pseudomonadota bacterium]
MDHGKLDLTDVVYDQLLPGARNWSFILRRGFALRLTDTRGGGNCSTLFFNAQEKLERYNMADTLKAQHTAYLTKGHVCYSDMGRILVSIPEDTCGWHDPIGGVSNAAAVRERFGEKRYQEARNAFYRDGRGLFLVEMGKWGLGRRDLVPNINFFSKVAVTEGGEMTYVSDNSPAGSYVDLRAELDTLVVLNTCPHPLDPATEWNPKPIGLTIFRTPPAAEDDVCRISCPENGRGFENTAIYHCQY